MPGLTRGTAVEVRGLTRQRVLAPGALAAPPPRRALWVRAAAAAGTSWWTLRTWWRVRQQLAGHQRGTGTLLSPAALPEPGRAHPGRPLSVRAARLTLACCRSTCLETALVRQARAAGAGVAADLVVGVTAPAGGFRAHAWLDGDRVDPQFMELWRFPAVRPGPDRPRRGA